MVLQFYYTGIKYLNIALVQNGVRLMSIGERIKIRRHQLSMKQEELAEGIVSTSYLSKIENGSKEASEEVLGLLCKKLGLSVIPSDQINKLERKLKKWFFELLMVNDRNEIDNLYKELSSTNISENDNLETLFLIGKIRYLIINNKFSSAIEMINKFQKVENLLTPFQKYYYLKFKGNYLYITKKVREALEHYLLAKDLTINLNLNNLEIGDLYYSIGISSNYVYDFKLCIEYTNRALDIYTKEFELKRMAECHINLGVIYKRSGDYMSAKEEYEVAEKVSTHIQNKRLIYITKYNIGNMLYQLKKFDECFHYFESCLMYAETLNSKLVCLLTMLKAYYKNSDLLKANHYVKEGNSLIKNFQIDAKRELIIEFQVFHHFLNNEFDEFEELLRRRLIPLLEVKEDTVELAFYYEFLGSFYKNNKKYKEASNVLEKANENLKRTYIKVY